MTVSSSHDGGLFITGLGVQYPAYLLGPEKLDAFARRFYDIERPGYVRSSHELILPYLPSGTFQR